MVLCHALAFSLGFPLRWRDTSQGFGNSSFQVGRGIEEKRYGEGVRACLCKRAATCEFLLSPVQGQISHSLGMAQPSSDLIQHNLNDRFFIPIGSLYRDYVQKVLWRVWHPLRAGLIICLKPVVLSMVATLSPLCQNNRIQGC